MNTRVAAAIDRVVDRLADGHDRHGQRWRLHLPHGDERSSAAPPLLALGLPTFGLAFAISVLTTYGPIVLIRLTDSPSQVGALIGAEGAFALVVPLLSGALSDRLPGSPARRRLPFLLAGAPFAVTGVVALPFGDSVAIASACVLAFFIGYYLYYPPYRALYADLLPRSTYARAQASQAVLRGVGLGAALIAGGMLLPVWTPLPFVLAAAAVVVATIGVLPVLRTDATSSNRVIPSIAVSLRTLLQSNAIRRFGVANTLWEFSFAGLKSFIVLYIVRGLGRSASLASAVIAVVAIAYIVAAPLAARLAERYGLVRVIRVSALVYGTGLAAGVFAASLTPLVIGLPFVALAGAIMMTLPQALAFTLAPEGSAGATAGLVDFSRGIGVVLGPIVVGAVIQAFHGVLGSTHGYAAMWPVIGAPVLASVLLLRRLG